MFSSDSLAAMVEGACHCVPEGCRVAGRLFPRNFGFRNFGRPKKDYADERLGSCGRCGRTAPGDRVTGEVVKWWSGEGRAWVTSNERIHGVWMGCALVF